MPILMHVGAVFDALSLYGVFDTQFGSKVSDIRDRWSREQAVDAEARRDNARRGGDNGGNGGEPPMSNLESHVEHLEQEVGIIRETMATKAELHQALNAQTWKIIGLMGVMTGLFTIIVKWV